ncbi:MAG: choice-of-anchor Q domain-containing protein [Gemmataceae bacterium]
MGGAVFNKGGSVTITNSTFTNNTVQGGTGHQNGQGLGGAIFNLNGSLTVLNATLSGNQASSGGRGIFSLADGTGQSSTVIINNSIIGQGDTAGEDVTAQAINGGTSNTSGTNNLIRRQSGFSGNIVSTANPMLSPSGNYGGPTQTLALLPGSPAIDVGNSSGAPTTDQRGKARVGSVDIGAFESQGFAIAATSGSGQTTVISTAFTNPLVATVSANNPIEPVVGGVVTFTPPSSGAAATLTGSPATIATDGTARVTATANGTVGSYSVSATAIGVTSAASFSLTNVLPSTTVSSINRTTPSGQLTNASGVTYTVTFANATLGLTASNFNLTGSAGIANTSIGTPTTSNGGLTWTVPISGLGSANGTLTLNLENDTGLNHTLTNLTFAGQTYTLDTVVPTVTGVTSSTGDGAYKAAATISIQVSFSEAVTVTGTPTLALNSGGTASYSSGSGTNTLAFTYTVSAGENAADLDYTSALALSGGTIQDAATNNANLTLASPGAAGSLGASKAIVIDTLAPNVSISAPSLPSVTPGGTVTYLVSYTDANFAASTLALSDITLNKTGSANGKISSVTGSGTTRIVTISNITGAGTLGISLAANTASDTLGQFASSAGPSATFIVRPNLKFDMKSSTKAPPTGWNSVLTSTAYSAATGFGWLSTTGLKGISAPVPSPLPLGTDATMYGDAVYGTGTATFRVFVGVGQTATVRVYSYLPFVALPGLFAGANVSVTGGGTGTVRSPLIGGTQPYVDVRGQANANGFLDVTLSVPTGHTFWAVNGLEFIPST